MCIPAKIVQMKDGLSNRGQNMAEKPPHVTDETADNSNAVIRGKIRDGRGI